MHIGNRLRDIRSLKRMTQAKASLDITSASHYSSIENGRFVPSNIILELLAERFSIPANYLIDRHIEDDEMNNLLKQYEELLNQKLLSKARSFRKKHEIKFEYIPSLTQEFHFRLLRCLELFKAREFEAFKKNYIEQVLPFFDGDSLDNLIPLIQENLDYISGLFYYMNDNYKKSIVFFNNVLEVNKDVSLQARLTFNMALANFYLRNYINALEYVEKSKDFYLNLHAWKKTAECYNLIAIIHKNQGDFKNSVVHINMGLQILMDEADETYPKLLHTLALLYRDEKKYSEALKTIQKCIVIKEKYQHDDLFTSYRAMLNILLEIKDECSIANSIISAQKACKSELDKTHLQVIEGKLYLLQNRHSDYEKYIQKCINYYVENEKWSSLETLPKELANYYAERKQFKKAYELIQICLIAYEKNHKGLQ